MCWHWQRFFLAGCMAVAVVQVALSGPPAAGDKGKADKAVRTDRYGDPLPPGAVYRIGTTRLRHAPTQLAFSADRKLVISCSQEKQALDLWNTGTGQKVRRLPARGAYAVFALSPDGSILAVNDLNQITLYHTATGKTIRAIDTRKLNKLYRISRLVFSSDGKVLTALHPRESGRPGGFSRWDTATGKNLGTRQMAENKPLGLSADGRLVATLTEKTHIIRLWNTTTGKQLREWQGVGKEFWPPCLTFSPDSRFVVTASHDAVLRVYEATSGKLVRSWKGRPTDEAGGKQSQDGFRFLAFAPDGKVLASVDRKHVLRIWDWNAGQQLLQFDEVDGPIAFSGDSRMIAAGGKDSRIRLWEAATGRDMCPFALDPGTIVDVIFSPNGRSLAVRSDHGSVCLLDSRTGRQLRQFPGYSPVAFSPKGDRLLVYQQQADLFGSLCLLDVNTGKVRTRFAATFDADLFKGWSPDGRTLITLGGGDSAEDTRIWDVATGKKLQVVIAKKKYSYVSCSPDARTVAVMGVKETTVSLFAADTGKEVRRLTGCCLEVTYRAQRRKRERAFHDLLRPAFSPEGRTLLTGIDSGSFGLWNVATGERLVRLSCRQYIAREPVFSSDGKLLSLLDNHGDPCLLETATGRLRHRLNWPGGDCGPFFSIIRAFSANGRVLATAYANHKLVLWEVATGRPIYSWPGLVDCSRGLSFSPDGRHLATISSDGTALIWDLTRCTSR